MHNKLYEEVVAAARDYQTGSHHTIERIEAERGESASTLVDAAWDHAEHIGDITAAQDLERTYNDLTSM